MWGPTGVTSVFLTVLNILHTRIELCSADLQTLAESECIPLFAHVTHGHGHLVDWLIENEQFAVSVVDQTARRVDGLFDQCVVIRLVFGGLVDDLQKEQTQTIDQHYSDSNTADDISTSIVLVVNHLYLKALYPNSTTKVRTLLTRVSININPM